MRWILGLQKQKQCKNFQTIVPSVYKIPQENVASVRNLPASLEKLQQIVELAMYVSTHLQFRKVTMQTRNQHKVLKQEVDDCMKQK
jgi:hypothetical protein